jgi:hypothetical protein
MIGLIAELIGALDRVVHAVAVRPMMIIRIVENNMCLFTANAFGIDFSPRFLKCVIVFFLVTALSVISECPERNTVESKDRDDAKRLGRASGDALRRSTQIDSMDEQSPFVPVVAIQVGDDPATGSPQLRSAR